MSAIDLPLIHPDGSQLVAGMLVLPQPALVPWVHVVDDDRQFLETIALQMRSVRVAVECYFSAEHFLATFASKPLECILLDLRMPNMSGLDLLRTLRARHCCPPVLMLSAFEDTPEVVLAMQLGALDYLVKPVDEQELLAKIDAALAQDQTAKARCGELSQRMCKLTGREREVMELFLEAKTTTQVAHALGISPKTIEKHRLRVFDKLNVDSVPALMRLMREVERRET